LQQRLGIGVGNDKLNALKAAFNHIVYSVATGPTHTKNRDAWFQLREIWNVQIDCHGDFRKCLPMKPSFLLKQ
jgi:hypothetical protein